MCWLLIRVIHYLLACYSVALFKHLNAIQTYIYTTGNNKQRASARWDHGSEFRIEWCSHHFCFGWATPETEVHFPLALFPSPPRFPFLFSLPSLNTSPSLGSTPVRGLGALYRPIATQHVRAESGRQTVSAVAYLR